MKSTNTHACLVEKIYVQYTWLNLLVWKHIILWVPKTKGIATGYG